MTSDNIPNSLLDEISSTIVDLSPNPVMILERTGVVVWCNKATFDIFKYTEKELTGKRINQLNFISDIEKPRYIKMLAEMLQGKPKTEFDTRLILPDGNDYEFHVSANLLIRNDGTSVIVVTLWDWKILSDSTKVVGMDSSQILGLDRSKQNLDLLRTIVDSAYEGILVIDMDGKLLYSNENFARMWSIPKELIATEDDSKLLAYVIHHLANPNEFLDKVQELYSSNEYSHDFIELQDGRIFERISHPLSKSVQKSGRIWRFRDVTENKTAEMSMKASAQRYRELMENVPGGVAIADNDNRFIYINPAFLRMLQYEKDEIIGMSVFDTIIPEHHNKLKEESSKRISGVSSTYDVIMLTKYGGQIITTLSAVPHRDDDGQVIGSIGLFIDNTERNLALEALSKSEQHYQELMEHVPGGVAIADNDNRFIYVNPAFLRILQYEKDEIIGMSVFTTIIPEHHNKLKGESQKRRGGISSTYDVIMLTKYDERIMTTLSAVPYRDDDGQVIGSIGLFIDNTERNLALEALSNSEQHYRELISQLPVGVALVTPDERLELVNEALATILGVPLDELHMKRFTDFMNPHDTEIIRQQTKTRQLGHSSVYDVDITQPSGNRRTLRISAAPNKNDDDVIVGTLGIMEDITLQKRNEQIRLLQEKEIELYESLLMHDIRNDLAIVVSYVEAVGLITQLDDEPAVFMKSAVAIMMRISNLLSGFGRPQELKERNLLQYLQFLADEAVGAYEKLTMNIESTENANDVNIAAGTLLSLVFQNLIRNTVQHVNGSPEIKIKIKRKHNMAQIIVQDNGTGIPAHIRSQLFQRGISTKGESGGLGLHLCKEIITSKGGTIELLPPEDGCGAAFLIEIPILS